MRAAHRPILELQPKPLPTRRGPISPEEHAGLRMVENEALRARIVVLGVLEIAAAYMVPGCEALINEAGDAAEALARVAEYAVKVRQWSDAAQAELHFHQARLAREVRMAEGPGVEG